MWLCQLIQSSRQEDYPLTRPVLHAYGNASTPSLTYVGGRLGEGWQTFGGQLQHGHL